MNDLTHEELVIVEGFGIHSEPCLVFGSDGSVEGIRWRSVFEVSS